MPHPIFRYKRFSHLERLVTSTVSVINFLVLMAMRFETESCCASRDIGTVSIQINSELFTMIVKASVMGSCIGERRFLTCCLHVSTIAKLNVVVLVTRIAISYGGTVAIKFLLLLVFLRRVLVNILALMALVVKVFINSGENNHIHIISFQLSTMLTRLIPTDLLCIGPRRRGPICIILVFTSGYFGYITSLAAYSVGYHALHDALGAHVSGKRELSLSDSVAGDCGPCFLVSTNFI